MSFSLIVPRSENEAEFAAKLFEAEATPKADGRTKVGKQQRELVYAGKDALAEIAYSFGETPMSGTISGHVNPDLTGTINVSLSLLAE